MLRASLKLMASHLTMMVGSILQLSWKVSCQCVLGPYRRVALFLLITFWLALNLLIQKSFGLFPGSKLCYSGYGILLMWLPGAIKLDRSFLKPYVFRQMIQKQKSISN